MGLPGFSQTHQMPSDSTLWQLSLPELQNYRTYYIQELEALQQEKQNLVQRGIEDGERLLRMQPNGEVIDQILIRLADLYYHKAKDEYFDRMRLFDENLLLYEQGDISEVPEEPHLDCSHSLEIYQRIIDEFPQSDLVDDAVYNKSYIFEEMGEKNDAIKIYLHLIDAYPKSQYVPEAFMRLAEHYFNPPVNDLDQAVNYYKKILQYKGSPRYYEALYKLGWAYYRLSEFPEAISYFTALVENFQIVKKYDPFGLSSRTDLLDEAVEYIAISFIDFGGPEKANEYLRGINSPEWGTDVLRKLGDAYMEEKEEYQLAVDAYKLWLDYSPYSSDAPDIERKIVECYRILNDEAETFTTRQRLFETYQTDGNWWKETDDEKAKLKAYRLSEQALRDNINAIVTKAEELSSELLYKKAVELGKTYLKSFPEDPYAYMIRWNVAIILDTKLHQYKDALQEYLTISLVYNTPQYEQFAREKGLATIKDASENAIVVADSLVKQERILTQQPVIVQLDDEKKRTDTSHDC